MCSVSGDIDLTSDSYSQPSDMEHIQNTLDTPILGFFQCDVILDGV